MCSNTARGFNAKTDTNPMPNLPILVRSRSLVDEKRRVSWLSMIASSMPSPKSSTWIAIVPWWPSPGSYSVQTSTTEVPASIAF